METWFALLGGGLALASAPILAPVAAAQASSKTSQPDIVQATFADPEPLVADKFVLGSKLRYPSPRLYDLDGDGTAEMVVGDLSGNLHVATKPQSTSGRHWRKLTPLTTDGTELKFNNW